EQAERRRAASVALARADAARDAQLVEQSRVEELAAELQAEADDLTERAAAAEALNAINALIHSTLDFDHVMQRALEQGVDAMATDVGAIELREQGSWIVRYQRGLSDAEIGRRMNDREAPCATRAASSREPFTIADLTAEGSMNVGLVASCDLRSVVSVPLIVRKEVIGCLLFYDRRPRSFSETEVDFARKLGVTVSLAVANARLFEVEQAELARVTVLQEVAVAAASSLEPARLSQNVLDRASSLLGASKGSVYLVDPDAGVARHVALMGYSAESLPALETLPLDDLTLSGRAIMTGEIQAPDPGDVPPETVRRAGSVGMADDRLIAVPLLVRGAPVGSLGLGFPGRRPFRDHEVELYRAVADQLGAALENARLFEAEVAAERRASAELRNADLLLESAKLLAGGLDQRAILDTLAVVVLEALPHSRVTVQLWDAASRTLTIAASHGTRPAPTGTEIAFDQTSPAFRDMLEHKATVVTDFDAVPVAARGQADKYASRLHLAVPLVAGQELLGVLVVDDPGERRPFGEREIALLEAIAAQAATAIAKAGVFERQRRIAQTLQENLIHPLPVVAGLELGVIAQTAYDPELVGGDFSDVFLLDDTHVVLLIADVAGKGVRAAGHTETVRSKVRALATIDPSPAFILARTNELLLRFDPDDPHVTAFLAVLDPTTGHLTYASAGHPAPVHLGAFSCRLLDVAFGPPLGSFSRAYANAHAMLTLEDYLVLYTDGVTEARQGIEMLGSDRLLEVVAGLRGRSAQEVADGVRDAALAYAGRLRDDLQVVVLRLA
ncbi:MAG: GAF domain-containing protein, partial [Thermoleophilia bacterium]